MRGDHDLEQLDRLFYPGSVAVIGATETPDRVGYNLLESVVYGGFRGRIYPVHPRLDTVLGLRVYPSLEEIPEPVDVALVALNQYATVDMVEECGRRGIRGVVCIAGGYKEMGEDGRDLEKDLAAAASRHGVKFIGPNTLGFLNTDASFYATFYPMRLKRGSISFLSQSGGVGLSIISRCVDEGLGINKWIGVGNRGSLEFSDYVRYLGRDEGTAAIGIFLEGTEDARRLVEVAGQVARTKPVVVYKAGLSDVASYAAFTHTGTMAGSHRLYMGAFRQYGLMAVNSVPELVAACQALSVSAPPAGRRVGVLTHTAGPSIIVMDRLTERGAELPPLSEETITAVRGVIGENPPVVLKNPLDAAGLGFLAPTYRRLAEAVLADPNVDMLVAIYCLHRNWRFPTAELIAVRERYGKPVVACYISTFPGTAPDRDWLRERGIPVYVTAEEAGWGAGALVRYACSRRDDRS